MKFILFRNFVIGMIKRVSFSHSLATPSPLICRTRARSRPSWCYSCSPSRSPWAERYWEKGNFSTPKLDETEGFQCLGHSNWTICSSWANFIRCILFVPFVFGILLFQLPSIPEVLRFRQEYFRKCSSMKRRCGFLKFERIYFEILFRQRVDFIDGFNWLSLKPVSMFDLFFLK